MDSPLKASGHHFKDDGSFYAFTDNNSNNNNNNTNNNPLGGSIPIGAGTNNNNNNSMSNSLETQLLVTPSSVFVNSSSANHNKYSKRGGANLNKDELFQLGLDLMHSEKGLKLQKRKKNFLAAPTSCFSGQQIIDWLSENLCISRKESLVVAYKLVNLNIFFETGINPNNNINNLDSGSGGNNSAGSSPTGSSTSISYSNNNTSTTTTTNINIRGGGSGNNIDTSSTSSLSASFGAMLSTTPSAVAFSLPHHHHTPQPSTSAHSGIRGSTSLMPPPSSSTTSTSLLSSSLKTSTSSFMPPPSSPLKSSSSTSFSNPNNHNSMSSNGFRLPVEDNPDVYYEFLTKPEAIISHVSMKRLSELHLAHKTLQSIPTTIINTLNYLKVLDFSYNALQDHSSLESVSTLYGLESLNLSYNALSDIPASLSRLEKLTKLNLSNNNFVNIPTCIFQLFSLEKLNMSGNVIVSIPESIQHLYKSLAHLDLRNNKITKLPKEVGLLAKLHTLDVSGYNKIVELPAYLATLPMLEKLEFPDSVKVPPRSVTSKGFSHIMGHLRDMIDGTVQLTDVKLIFLGPEKSGKTQLVRSLTKSSSNKTIKMGSMRRHSGSVSISSAGTTIINPRLDTPQLGESVEQTEWKIELPVSQQQQQQPQQTLSVPVQTMPDASPKTMRSSKLSKRAVKLMALDFKFIGSAVYTSTHSFFLSERAFYLITVDITKEPLSQLDLWVNSVKAKAPTAPIYIVATHIDHYAGDIMKALHQIEGFLNERMLEVTGVIGVATNTSRNIDLLRQEIITTLANQCNHWFSEQTPAVYVQLEKQLEEEARRRSPPVIAWDEYVNIAKLANITTHEKLVRATNTLHRWGSIMWFDEEKHGLNDLVILSPQWLSDCFAAIVMSKNTHIQSDSILSLKKLHHIWKDPAIPGFLHMKLIRMLERFNILFTLKSNGQNTSLQDLSLPLSEANRSVSSPLPTLSPEPVLTSSSFISTSSTSSFMTSIVNSSPSMLRSSMKLLKPATTAAAAAAGMSSGGSSASTSGNISSSSSHENIAQFIQGTKIIVPCLLPAAKPSHLASMWDTWGGEDMHQVGRYYTFLNAPKSCFDRLMVRFLYTMEPIVYYGSGILFRKPQNMKDSVKSSMSSCGTLVEFDHQAQQIQVRVRGHDYESTSKMFQLVLENVDTLLKDLGITPSKTLVTCSCSLDCQLDKQTPTYPIEMVESAFGKGEAYIKCPKSQKLVSIETLSPDIALACPSTTKIGTEELAGFVEIGHGASAKVFRATLRGAQTVAVKQFSLDRMDLPDAHPLVGGSGSPTPNSSGHHFTRAPSSSSLSSASSADEANQLQGKLTAINEFRREVWLMSDLVHQNIVHMKGYSLDPYSIVMEYMDLGSLSSYLRQKRELGETLPWEIILKIAKDIAKGMAFLHNISPPLVHRDLKSPNILLATTPTEPFIVAKISDFGLSRTVVQSFVSKVVDNPTWLAPEVISQREYNEKGDIYSLGIILWELYHMQLPFEEFGIKFMSTLEDSIISGLRPTINPQCNAMYSSLITKCWNENPQSRPSFPTIVKALEEIHDNIKKTSSSSSLQNK